MGQTPLTNRNKKRSTKLNAKPTKRRVCGTNETGKKNRAERAQIQTSRTLDKKSSMGVEEVDKEKKMEPLKEKPDKKKYRGAGGCFQGGGSQLFSTESRKQQKGARVYMEVRGKLNDLDVRVCSKRG